MKTKFLEARWNLEKKFGRLLIGMVLLGVVAFSEDLWLTKAIATIGNFIEESIIEDLFGVSYRYSSDIMTIFMLYMIVILTDTFVKFTISSITKLFKKSNHETEVSE